MTARAKCRPITGQMFHCVETAQKLKGMTMRQLTFLSEERPAKASLSRVCAKAWMIRAVSSRSNMLSWLKGFARAD